MTNKSRLLASAAVAVALPLTSPAHAQENVFTLDEIIVESLRDVATDTAVAETTLDQEELDTRQASTLAEALGTIPGVTLSNAATPQGSTINIRGLGADAGTFGSNTKVSVVVDGVSKGQEEIYRQGSLLSMEPELFKTVKVVRGPAESFRFSSGAIGGTVEAVTKDAADFLEGDDTFAFRQKLSFGSNGNEKMSTSILAWRPSDRLDVIGFFGYREADDYEDGSGNVETDTGYKMPSGLVKLKYFLTDDLTITGSYSKTQNQLRDVNYDLLGSLFSARVDADIEDETALLALNYNPAGNDMVNLTAKLTYTDELIENISSTTTSTIYNADNRTEKTTFILENEAEFRTGAWSHTLLAGLETGSRERSSLSHTGLNAGASPGGTDDFTAIYITDTIENGGLTLTPQLRYETQTITGKDNGLATDGTEYDASDWAGALSARYGFDSGFAVFGTAAYNSNLPIIDDLTNAARIETTEKAKTYELGASYEGNDQFVAGDQLSAKLTGFKTEISDNATYTNYASFTSATADTTNIDMEGLEFELSYVNPNFYVDFNAQRIRGKWGDGTWFNNAPQDRAQLTVGKRFMDDQLDVALEVTHAWSTDRNYQFGGAVEVAEAYTKSDLLASYTPNSGTLEDVSFHVAVENLFDKTYQPYLSSRPAAGRTFKFSVAKVF